MRIKDLFESTNSLTVYHGDNHNTRTLQPRLMNNGNNQEGVGIYFSDRFETTKAYGSQVVKAEIDIRRFVESRRPVSILDRNGISRIMYDMVREDKEAFFYLATDYGIYLEEPEDLERHHIEELSEMMRGEEIRNFQTLLAGAFGVEAFVKSWNKWLRVDGTYNFHNSSERWFAIINPKIQLQRV